MKKKDEISESELILRILNGEKALYELIVRRYNPSLYKVGRSYNYNHEDAQDLMQDTFVDAFKHLRSFENRAQFKTWIMRIMLNNCYNKRQKSGYKNEVVQDIPENAQPAFTTDTNDTLEMVHRKELKTIVENALVKIPHDYRMVFSLRSINEFSVADTANLLGITESNVKVRLNRAKTMLVSEINKKYRSNELFDFNLKYCDGIVSKVLGQIKHL